MALRLPRWIVVWLYISCTVVLWDALYVLMRPRSMEGGDLYWIWSPYSNYIKADKRYADMQDGFGLAQSWINLGETAIALFALLLHHSGRSSCIFYAFVAQLLCMGKTVCYFLTEYCSGLEYTGHSLRAGDPFTFWIVFALPSSFWIVFPFFVCLYCGNKIIQRLNSHPYSNKKRH